jgi:hypothetical protein
MRIVVLCIALIAAVACDSDHNGTHAAAGAARSCPYWQPDQESSCPSLGDSCAYTEVGPFAGCGRITCRCTFGSASGLETLPDGGVDLGSPDGGALTWTCTLKYTCG